MNYRLSERLNVRIRTRTRNIYTPYDYLKEVLVKSKRNFLKVFSADIINYDNFEEDLYIEPRDVLYETGDPWRNLSNRDKVEYRGYTNSEELEAILSDKERLGIFLVGEIGMGKSTFIYRFHKAFNMKDGQISIYLDFSEYRDGINSMADYDTMRHEYFSRLEKTLYEILRDNNIFDSFLKYVIRESYDENFIEMTIRMDEGGTLNMKKVGPQVRQWGRQNYLKYISFAFRFLKSKGFHILLILDNIDPIPVRFQEQFANNSLELVNMGDLQVIVAIRYYSWKIMTRVASGFRKCLILSINLPNICDLINKRVEYFIFNNLHEEFYKINIGKYSNLVISKDSLEELVATINSIIFGDRVIDSFILLSDMNLRLLMQNYVSIIDSRYINLNPKILHKFFEKKITDTKIFNISGYDLLLKSILSESGVLYKYDSGRIENVYNLYSIEKANRFTNLLKIYLLNIIYNMSVIRDRRRFIKKNDIIAETLKLGWRRNEILAALREMYSKTLLIGYSSSLFDFNDEIAPSQNAFLYKNKISRMVYYMFFMSFDFPMPESRILKYFFKRVTEDGADFEFILRRENKYLFDDDFVHIFVAEFLEEFINYEKKFLTKVTMNQNARDVLSNLIREPITAGMVRSFARHIRVAEKHHLKDRVDKLFLSLRHLNNMFPN